MKNYLHEEKDLPNNIIFKEDGDKVVDEKLYSSLSAEELPKWVKRRQVEITDNNRIEEIKKYSYENPNQLPEGIVHRTYQSGDLIVTKYFLEGKFEYYTLK